MFEFFIFLLIGTFLYYGGLEGVIGLISGLINLVINVAFWIPVIVGILFCYGIYWITYVY